MAQITHGGAVVLRTHGIGHPVVLRLHDAIAFLGGGFYDVAGDALNLSCAVGVEQGVFLHETDRHSLQMRAVVEHLHDLPDVLQLFGCNLVPVGNDVESLIGDAMHLHEVLQFLDALLHCLDASQENVALLRQGSSGACSLVSVPKTRIGSGHHESSAAERLERAAQPRARHLLHMCHGGVQHVHRHAADGPVVVVAELEHRLSVEAHLVERAALQQCRASLHPFLGWRDVRQHQERGHNQCGQ